MSNSDPPTSEPDLPTTPGQDPLLGEATAPPPGATANLTPETTPPASEETATKLWTKRLDTAVSFAVVAGVVTFAVIGVLRSTSSTELDVIASARRSEPAKGSPAAGSTWTIEGRVFDSGQYVENAIVWAVVSDEGGYQYSPDLVSTDQEGKFSITATIGDEPRNADSRSLEGRRISRLEADLQARKGDSGWGSPTKHGRRTISLTGAVQPQVVTYATSAIWLILIWFGASFVLAFATCMLSGQRAWWSYHLSVALTFTLSLAIIVGFYLAVGELVERQTTAKGDAVTLGFVSIFKGTYLPDGEDELLVSLSSPAERAHLRPTEIPFEMPVRLTEPPSTNPASAGPSDDLEDGVIGEKTLKFLRARFAEDSGHPKILAAGFGAPLWVIVLAVIGATLLTVTLVLQEIESPPNFANTDDLRKRMRNIVAQQLFMLFAPLGGIFLYQALLVAEAAEQPLAVGTAALGAGASLNYLLAKAVEVTGGLLKQGNSSA